MQQHIYPTEIIVQYAYILILCWQMCRNTSSSMSTDIFSRKQNVWNASCHTWLSWEWMICFSSVIFSGGRDILGNLSSWNVSAMFQEYTTHRFVFAASRMCNKVDPDVFILNRVRAQNGEENICKSEDEKLYFITFQRKSL